VLVAMANSKCEHCGKQIFHAELKRHDDMKFHAQCFPKWKKENEDQSKKKHDAVNYEKPADVQPAYYRAEDRDSKQKPRLETGAEYKQ